MNDDSNTNRPSDEPAAQAGDAHPEQAAAGPRTGGPGGPGAPAGPGGAGGAGSGPPADDESRRTVIVIVAAVLAALVLVVGLIVFLARGDDSEEVSSATSAPVSSTSAPSTTDSTVPDSTTTSTTSSTSTTTSSTTSTTSSTTTAVPTTTVAASTTSAPATSTTVSIPVVTVPPAPATTLWDIIVNSPDLSAFAELAEMTGVDDILDGTDPITVFVPSNQALERFAAGIGNDDLTTEELSELLRHHIVSEALLAEDVLLAEALTALFGPDLIVDADAATIDGAQLLVVDVEAGNSVLHVVDRVLVIAS